MASSQNTTSWYYILLGKREAIKSINQEPNGWPRTISILTLCSLAWFAITSLKTGITYDSITVMYLGLITLSPFIAIAIFSFILHLVAAVFGGPLAFERMGNLARCMAAGLPLIFVRALLEEFAKIVHPAESPLWLNLKATVGQQIVWDLYGMITAVVLGWSLFVLVRIIDEVYDFNDVERALGVVLVFWIFISSWMGWGFFVY